METKPVYFFDKTSSVRKNTKTLSSTDMGHVDNSSLEERIISAIRTVYDPEIPVNVYDLGLIYLIKINDSDVLINMTLTAPACPVAEILPAQVAEVVKSVEGVKSVNVEMVWQPAWSQENMSDEAKLTLGLF